MTRSVIGAFTYRTQRVEPASGQVTLLTDPVPGYPDTLLVSLTDRFGNSVAAAVSGIVASDAIVIVTDSGAFGSVVTADPAGAGTYIAFPFTVRLAFDPASEPTENSDVLLLRASAAGWPTVVELAQILDIDDVVSWQTTLDRVLAAAITTTKGVVGNWDDAADTPNDNQSAAALRLAELMSLRPDASVDSLIRDASFAAYLTGQHRKFGVA